MHYLLSLHVYEINFSMLHPWGIKMIARITNTALMAATIHLGFDMGIRNLAFCLVSHTSVAGAAGTTAPPSVAGANAPAWEILAWDNVDLLAGGVSTQDANRCRGCKGPAAWVGPTEDALWCKGCATGVRRKKTATQTPSLSALPCGTGVRELRALGIKEGWADKKTAKAELLVGAAERHLMPWKAPKARQPSLALLRRQMDAWLDRMLPTFAAATLIRLENQPVMKGPTMKSVQMMLFTLLGHRLEREHGWGGEIVFVHAGVKTRDVGDTEMISDAEGVTEGATTTAEGREYRARKKTAEAETLRLLEEGGKDVWKRFFTSRSKKSDLADAFLMAMRA
jgi:Mitochondrial resolvase Ydc2 / RNA splicing MRS1